MRDLIYGRQRKIKRSYPNQFICEEKANGIMCNGNFYQYRTIANGSIYPKVGRRVFLKSITAIAYASGITAQKDHAADMTIDGYTGAIFAMHLPALTQATDYYSTVGVFEYGIIGDDNTPFELYLDSNLSIIIRYALIDSLPGDLNPKVIEE